MQEKTAAQSMYEQYPSHWLRNTLIGLAIVAAVSWSATSVHYSGLAAKGLEVATGIIHGITHPDTALLFSTATDGVPYLLLQTIAIAILGTIFGSILAIPFSFLASENIVPKWFARIVRLFTLMIRIVVFPRCGNDYLSLILTDPAVKYDVRRILQRLYQRPGKAHFLC